MSTKRQAELVAQSKKGNAESFGLLYDAFVVPVYRYVYYRVSSRETAEDITELTFLRAYENIHSFKQKKNLPFSAWLYRIAHNAIIDDYRANSRMGTVELNEAIEVQSAGRTSAELVDASFNAISVRAALQKLPVLQQQVLVLRFINDCSVEETAASCGKSSASVRVLQHRGLKRLKELLSTGKKGDAPAPTWV